MVENTPRPLDHLVLQVPDLDEARRRLAALGFTVAPDGVHPFGTANCCVFFADGTFLEPLAIADPELTAETAWRGNIFTSHALGFRDRNGPEGFSATVFGTGDARSDHAAFTKAGISGGDMLPFGRDFVTADGTRDRAEFLLAFALADGAPDALFFTCERVAVPKVDRSALLRHANGVTGIAGALMTSTEPEAMSRFLADVAGVRPEAIEGGLRVRSGAFGLDVLTPEALAETTGLQPVDDQAPCFRVVVFGCADSDAVREHLQGSGVEFHDAPAGIVVPPVRGQGAAFVFREAT